MLNDCAGVGLNLKRGLEAQGIQVTLYYFGTDPYFRYEGMRVPKRGPSLMWFLVKEVAKYDVIHYHQGPVQPNIPVPVDYVLAKATHKKVVVHYHGEIREYGGKKYRMLSHRLMNNNPTVLVPTPDLLEWVPQAIWFRNPVDSTVFTPKHVDHGSQIRILHPSTQEWRKGTKHVEQVTQKLQAKGHNIELKIIGQRHPVQHSMMPEYYRWSDIVIDQLEEGFYGITSVEAMMCGRPVLCYWKFHKFDEPPFLNTSAEELEDHLLMLVNSSKLRMELGEVGRKWAVTHHDISVSTKRLLEIYGE